MAITLRQKQLSNGKQSLYLDIYCNQQRHYEFLNLYQISKPLSKIERAHNKEVSTMAKILLNQRELEISSQGGYIPKHKKDIFLCDYVNKIALTKSYHTQKTYNQLLNYLKIFNPNAKVNDIDKKFLQQFREFLSKQVSLTSVKLYESKLIFVINLATKEHLLLKNPYNDLPNVQANQKMREHLTVLELKKMITLGYDSDIQKAFLFSVSTGLRVSDVTFLEFKNINIENKTLHIEQSKTKENILIPLTAFAYSLIDLTKATNPENRVFELPTIDKGTPMPNHTAINKKIKEWVRLSKIDKNISFHNARHTFAVLLLTENNDIYTVSKMLGHQNLTTTQIYAKLVDKNVSKAIDSLANLGL